MELQHRFTVPAGVEEAWAHFNDIEGVAGCFPGATVTEADEESFTGTVKVKLGPIALVYNGSGTFVEKDEAAHRLVIDAKGKDKRGNGTAGAKVTATMTPSGADATDIEVLTDLSITGKAAQFGRGGVIQDVSDKLLGQFVACLEEQLSAPPAEAAAEEEPPAPHDDGALAGPDPGADAPADSGTTQAVPDPAAPGPSPGVAGGAPPPTSAPPASRQQQDDALDLGATVLPVLVRAYWKQALAGLALLVVVIWLIARD